MQRIAGLWLAGMLAAGVAVGQEAATGGVTAAVSVAISGQCRCGKVKYAARGPALKCSTCDCRGCQRASGALVVPYVSVSPSGFSVTSGTATAYRATSGARCDVNGTWHYCAACGGPLYWTSDRGDTVDLLAGALADPGVFRLPK